MSFFLMVAAVALTAMLFRFHVEQRNRESGLLAAVGVPAGKVLRWRLAEGLCVVVAGSVLGAPAGGGLHPRLAVVARLDLGCGAAAACSGFMRRR